jgi:hypothetical protein
MLLFRRSLGSVALGFDAYIFGDSPVQKCLNFRQCCVNFESCCAESHLLSARGTSLAQHEMPLTLGSMCRRSACNHVLGW